MGRCRPLPDVREPSHSLEAARRGCARTIGSGQMLVMRRAPLPNSLIRPCQDVLRNGQPECLCRSQIDDQLELRRLLDR